MNVVKLVYFFFVLFSCLLLVLNIRVGDESKSSVLWKIQSEIQINSFLNSYCGYIHYQYAWMLECPVTPARLYR